MPLSARIHDTPIQDILGAWREVFAADPAATPFVSPEWAAAWCRHWGAGHKPWVVVVEDGTRVEGLAALALSRRPPFRILRGLGVGVGNSWDVLSRPERRDEVTAAVAEALAAHRSEWDVLDVDRLPAASATPSVLREAGLRLEVPGAVHAPRLQLPGSFEEYLGARSATRRKRIRRSLRPLTDGLVEVQVVERVDELPRLVADNQRLRAAWWEHRGRAINPEHVSERFGRFVVDTVSELLPQGRALVRRFVRSGETVATSIDLLDADTLYFWQDGIDPRLVRLGFGHAITASAIRTAIERGLGCFDFMVGDQAYKFDWGAEDVRLAWVRATHEGVRSQAARAARAAATALRARRAVLSPAGSASGPSTAG